MTTALLLERAQQIIPQRGHAIQAAGSFERWFVHNQQTSTGVCQEFLWELALKVRIQVSEADTAIRFGVIDKMLARILSARADHLGGWTAIMKPLLVLAADSHKRSSWA